VAHLDFIGYTGEINKFCISITIEGIKICLSLHLPPCKSDPQNPQKLDKSPTKDYRIVQETRTTNSKRYLFKYLRTDTNIRLNLAPSDNKVSMARASLETARPATLEKAAKAAKLQTAGVEIKDIAAIQKCSVVNVKGYLSLHAEKKGILKQFVDNRADFLAGLGLKASAGLDTVLDVMSYRLQHPEELTDSTLTQYGLMYAKVKSFSHAEERLERNLSTQNVDIHQLDMDTSRLYERVSELMGKPGKTIDATADTVG